MQQGPLGPGTIDLPSTADLSSLDDQLGKLYWQARRAVANPKAFRADSDSKWAWREANCSDEACLRTWYTGRIEELQRLLASLPSGKRAEPSQPSGPSAPSAPALRELPLDVGRRAFADDDTGARRRRLASEPAAVSATTLQCTAADPGLVLHDQCTTVLKQDAHWHYPPRPGDWFCGVATLAQTPPAAPTQQAAAVTATQACASSAARSQSVARSISIKVPRPGNSTASVMPLPQPLAS